jgi:hypothetical protein
MCGELTAGRRRFMLLTCHTPDFDADRLERLVCESFVRSDQSEPGRVGPDESGRHAPARKAVDGIASAKINSQPLMLSTAAGRRLPSGVAVRWETDSDEDLISEI